MIQPRTRQRFRRAFVVTWIVLGLAGALDHTIAERYLGGSIDLKLPHLAYGYVMFNDNLRLVPVFTYARADGVRHDLADLDPRPAFGYKRARTAVDAMLVSRYMRDLCNRALTSADDAITITIEGYQVDVDPDHPSRTSTVTCDAHPAR